MEISFLHILAFICGIVACYAFFWLSKRNALSIVRDKAGEKGRLAKEEQESRLMSFMLEIKATYDLWKSEGGTDLKDFGLKKLPAVALKYPDVLLKQGKQLMKMLEGEGLGGLEELL